MLSSRICIVARSMSRISDGAKRTAFIVTLMIAALLGSACKDLEGRQGNRTGNRLFREMQFIDAAAAYERALKQVKKDQPIINYNLGLAYSKMYRPAYERPILLGELDDPVCTAIPKTQQVQAQVCVKRPDAKDQGDKRRFNECDEKNVCPSSFDCKKTTFCAATSADLADLAATNLQIWIKAQPSDAVLDAELRKIRDEIRAAQATHEARMAGLPEGSDARAAEIQRNKAVMDELNKRVDERTLKEDMRTLMTQAWIDTNQFSKALAFWEQELEAKPEESRIPRIMGNVAGIHLKDNNWKKAIEWFRKVAAAEKDPDQKVAALNSIGNVAWSKLNSKSLDINDSVELADQGIGALQEAAEIRPKLSKLYSLQAVIFNFRALTHGASFAAAIDRANAQDLLRLTRVLIDEAKQQQSGQTAAPPAAPPAPTTPSTPGSTPPAPASPSMSGGPAPKTGG
jgi:tetratricopeptide (TPR) repeat protein